MTTAPAAPVCSRRSADPCPATEQVRRYANGHYCPVHAPGSPVRAACADGRPVRVLVTGSRAWDEPARVHRALAAFLHAWPVRLVVVVRDVRPDGAERHAVEWAHRHRDHSVTQEPRQDTSGAVLCLAFISDASPRATRRADAAHAAGIPTIRYTATTVRPATGPRRKDTMHRPDNPLKTAALACAERGWHVFPLVPGAKRPAVSDWENRATTETARIERCWNHAPYNIGLATGPSGLVVVDLDTAKEGEEPKEEWSREDVTCGADVLAVIAERHDAPYPDGTYAVATPSGGSHLYFLAPDGPALRNTAGTLGWKVDTRAVGGYVVAAGSAVGQRPYTVTVDTGPAPLPAWLTGLLRPAPLRPVEPAAPATRNASRYADAVLTGETDNVARTREGGRNQALYQAARNVGKFVAFGDLTRAEVEERLLSAALAAGLTEREAVPAIRSALNYSIARYPHGREAA